MNNGKTYHINNPASVTNVTDEGVEVGNIAYVGIGTNLGDRAAHVAQALQALAAEPAIEFVKASSLYETAPVGKTDQPDFLNAVAALRTSLPPRALLDALLHIENRMGRVRNLRWGPRVIDLDLLLYGDAQIQTPGLTIPHPRLRERAFVLIPLAEIAPDLRLPGDGKRIRDFGEILSGGGNIRRRTVV